MSKTTRSTGHRIPCASVPAAAAITSILFGLGLLGACGPAGGVMEADGAAPDASGPPQNAAAGGAASPGAGGSSGTGGTGGAMVASSKGGASGGGSQAAGGAMAPTDAGATPPPANQACTVGAQCASGFCVDGVCCDTACDGACQSCSQTGKVGTCSPVKNATDDMCTGGSTCDATGACRRILGQSCSAASQCASANCVDGVCCATAGCGKCQACTVPGFEGTCAPVDRFVDDETCTGTNTCNGLGECRGKNGSACTAAVDCVSLNCVDGVCCNTACDGACFSCNQAQSPGTCLPLDNAEDPSANTPCGGINICAVQSSGQPACKLKSGRTCSTNAECASGACETVVVPPDPNDPYDAGYSYTRCQ